MAHSAGIRPVVENQQAGLRPFRELGQLPQRGVMLALVFLILRGGRLFIML
jgi:hypothetical protein